MGTAERWTDPTDVKDVWLLDPDDLPAHEVLDRILGRAERILTGLDPNLPTRAAPGTPLGDCVRDVAVDMAVRVLRNPEGLRTVSETTGPMTTQVTHGGEEPGVLYVTDAERQLLGIRSRRRQHVFSVSTRPRR